MKVLFYSALSLRFGGGFEHWLLEVTSRLKKYGVSSTIVCTKSTVGDPERVTYQRIHDTFMQSATRYIELPYTLLPLFSSNSPIPRVSQLNGYIHDCDIVYFSNAYAFQDLIFYILTTIHRKAIISGQRSTLFSESRPHNLYINTLGKRLMKQFDAYHVLNTYDLHFFKRWGLEKIYLIPPGVDTQRFKPINKQKHERFKALFVGRLTSQKGIDVLCQSIETINQVSSKLHKKIEFTIIGSGPLEPLIQRITRKYSDTVTFLGAVQHNQLPEIYAQNDLFLMPSRRETFGNVALEAQACGLPVVASDIPGPSDIILNDITGTLVRKDDANAVVTAIRQYYSLWLQDYDRYLYLRNAARKHAVQRFDWEIVAERLFHMFVNVRQRADSRSSTP